MDLPEEYKSTESLFLEFVAFMPLSVFNTKECLEAYLKVMERVSHGLQDESKE